MRSYGYGRHRVVDGGHRSSRSPRSERGSISDVDSRLFDRCRAIRRDDSMALLEELEEFDALKHALGSPTQSKDCSCHGRDQAEQGEGKGGGGGLKASNAASASSQAMLPVMPASASRCRATRTGTLCRPAASRNETFPAEYSSAT